MVDGGGGAAAAGGRDALMRTEASDSPNINDVEIFSLSLCFFYEFNLNLNKP